MSTSAIASSSFHPIPPSPNHQTPTASSHPNNKPCTLCLTPRPVLVRCQIDQSGKWNFVCPGKCWKSVSGGVEDAKGLQGEFPWYRYGGMWKNKHAYVSAKKKTPKKVAGGPDSSSTTPVPVAEPGFVAGVIGSGADAEESTGDTTADSGGRETARTPGTNETPDGTCPHPNFPLPHSPSLWKPNTFYPRSTLIIHTATIYICRRDHTSKPLGGKEASAPEEKKGYRFWKVDDEVMRGLTAEESE